MRLTFYVLLTLQPGHGILSEGSISPVLGFFKMRNIGSVNVAFCDMQGLTNMLKDPNDHPRTYKGFASIRRPNYFNDSTINEDTFHSQQHRIGILLDLACQSSWNLLQKASSDSLFNTSYVYAVVSNAPMDTALESLEPLKIRSDSDFTLFTFNQIYDLHRTGFERPITVVHCGNYTVEDGISTYFKPPRWDLEGVTINAATVKGFKLEDDGMDKFLDHTYRTEIDALSRFPLVAHHLVEYLCNFKTNLTIAPDWGYLQPETGRFDPVSMFGWMEQGKIDLGITLSSVNPTRLVIASYTRATYKLKSSVVFRHPAVGASYDGFARPFSNTTWLAMGLFVLFSSLVLSIITWREVEDTPPNEPGFTVSLLYVVAIISVQGSYIQSTRIPLQLISISLHIFGLVLYSYYGAIVVGFLLSPAPRTITTVEKLLESGMDMWVENVSFHRNHFEWNISSKATLYYEKAIRGKAKDKDKFLERTKALTMVRKGGVALYGQNIEMYKIIQNTFPGPEICSLHYILMVDVQLAVTTRKNSPYFEIYKKGVLRFTESGFLDAEHKRWHSQRPACYGSESTNPVKLEATSIALFTFGGGVFLAVIILTVEILHKYVSTNKIRRRRTSHQI